MSLKISVIVPVLNESEEIEQTLLRIKSYKPFEIIVGDGGSNDETLAIAEKLGVLLSQLINESITSIDIECYGTIEEPKPICISFLKGLFINVTDNRINFINASSVAEERGISISHSYSSEKISYSNFH